MHDEPEATPHEPPGSSLNPPALRTAAPPAPIPGPLSPAATRPASSASLAPKRDRIKSGPEGDRLALWEKLGLTGSGALVLGAAFLAPHVALPLALASLFVGGGMVTVGLGFRRPLLAFRMDKGGFAAETETIKETVAIAKDAEELTRSRLAIVRSWTQDQQRVLAFIAESTDAAAAETTRRVADFVRNRLADLTETLAESDEDVRASVWLMSPHTGRLQFAIGSEIEDPGKTFAAGEGFIGRAFAENEIKNIADAPRRPEYASPEPDDPFHGLLCIPLNRGNGPSIGVLCVDRTNAQIFPSSAVDLSATLGVLLVGVLTAPPTRP